MERQSPPIQLTRDTSRPGHLERLWTLHELLSSGTPQGTRTLRFDAENDPCEIAGRRDLDLSGTPGPRSVTSLLGDELRPFSRVVQAGADVVNLGITAGEQHLPAIDLSQRAAWGGSAENVEPSTPLALVKPLRVSATISVSTMMVRQSGLIGSEFVMRQLNAALGAAVDHAALAGDGTGGSPTGVLNDSDITDEGGTGGITLARLADMERTVADAYGEIGEFSMVMAPDVRETMRTTPTSGTEGEMLWPTFSYRKIATPHMPDGALIVGDLSQLVIPFWGGIEVIVNPYSRDNEGVVRLTANLFADVIALRPESFVFTTSAAAA